MTSYQRGDWVEVLTEAEILATLDGAGALDGLPFMPEMRAFCGRRLRVVRRADRVCVEGEGERLMNDTVFLEDARCDGASHDGCQRACLMFWKTRWLKSAASQDAGRSATIETPAPSLRPLPVPTRSGDRYYCQSTEIARATHRPPKSMVAAARIVVDDLRHNEISGARFVWTIGWLVLNKIHMALGRGLLGQPKGDGSERSKGDLGLKPGDIVTIRPLAEIAKTLDAHGKNNGLSFDSEMRFYHGQHVVERQVERIILETTGKMRTLTKTVTLQGVACQGLCAKNCPRANPIYWREIWLEKKS